jgi:hypothetical protein
MQRASVVNQNVNVVVMLIDQLSHSLVIRKLTCKMEGGRYQIEILVFFFFKFAIVTTLCTHVNTAGAY